MINGKRLVALCTSRVYDPQIHGFIIETNERLKAAGFSLLIFTINSDIYWEEDRIATEKYVYDLIPYQFIDAVIIMDEKIKSHKIAMKIIAKAKKFDLPVVVADGTYEGVSCVTWDYQAGFESVVRHIIEHHHVMRPHMMAGHRNNVFSDQRIDVFKKVLFDNGIPFDDSMVSYGEFWADPCRREMRKLLDRGELPDAIICANDIMAVTVSEMLISEGYKIPDDVLVSGFDGYDEIYFTEPKITTGACDILKMAQVTCDQLLEEVKTRRRQNHLIEPIFIANQSCGCPEHSEHPTILRNWFKESFARLNDDNRVLQMVASAMQTSPNPETLVSHLESYKLGGSIVVADRKCFTDEMNYFTDEETLISTKEFIMIYDYEHPEKYKVDTFKLKGLTDNYNETVLSPSVRDRILEATEYGYPLIFNALDFLGRPFGFICFSFRDYLISNYTNTLAVTNAISSGVGGFVNIKYQRMLLNKMDEMYLHDPLTGLYNRIGFQNHFDALRKKPNIYNKKATIMMSDLDGLKNINDNYGHAEGDNAIKAVASSLADSVPEGSLTTRFGGDEIFSVVFGECDSNEIMRKIDEWLFHFNRTSGKPYKVSTSIGYVEATINDAFDISHAIREADEQMYKIKSAKHNTRRT